MKVRELIELLLAQDPEAPVVICADNGTEDEPSDLTCAAVRSVSEGPETNDAPTVGVWTAWKTTIDTDVDAPLT